MQKTLEEAAEEFACSAINNKTDQMSKRLKIIIKNSFIGGAEFQKIASSSPDFPLSGMIKLKRNATT